MSLRSAVYSTSGNADTLVAGSTIAGTSVNLGDNARQKVKELSALVTVDAETTSLTFAAKLQVSNDNSTWYDISNGSQNAAAVVLATGTAGADASVSKVFTFPAGTYGWRYARLALVTAGATGAAVDTYSISYYLRTA
jgi:hypothetical protein